MNTETAIEEAEYAPLSSEVRKQHSGKAQRRSRGGGKSENPAAVAGFSSAVGKSCLWTFPRNAFFHGPCTQPIVPRA